MNRREFLHAGLGTGALLPVWTGGPVDHRTDMAGSPRRFRLRYAPHFGMFRHSAGADLIDQIRFMADQGFTALEDTGLKDRPRHVQERIGRELDRRGMTMGLFVGTADFGNPTFASGRPDLRERVLHDLRDSIEAAKRVGATCCSIVPGLRDPRLQAERQTANAVDALKSCADLCEPAGLVLLLEPLTPRENSPHLFLQSIAQAAALCRKVGSPRLEVLFDVCDRHAEGTDLTAAIDRVWNEIGYFQLGDYPGRKEPGTGEIDFRRVFRHIAARGYDGLLGMDHGTSTPGCAGEQAVVASYLAHDRF